MPDQDLDCLVIVRRGSRADCGNLPGPLPPLPLAHHRLVNAVLGRQLRRRQLTLQRLQRNTRLELSPIPLPARPSSGPYFSSGEPSLTTYPKKRFFSILRGGRMPPETDNSLKVATESALASFDQNVTYSQLGKY